MPTCRGVSCGRPLVRCGARSYIELGRSQKGYPLRPAPHRGYTPTVMPDLIRYRQIEEGVRPIFITPSPFPATQSPFLPLRALFAAASPFCRCEPFYCHSERSRGISKRCIRATAAVSKGPECGRWSHEWPGIVRNRFRFLGFARNHYGLVKAARGDENCVGPGGRPVTGWPC